MTDLTGQSIGRYQILARLGEGGMATVYKARDTRLDRDVALKLIRVDQFAPAMMDQILKRFEREAKSLARLSHNSIVRVYDYGEHDGVPYLVLEFCGGGDLKQRMTGQPMDWRDALELILPVARALRYSHQQGIIHRDIKPSNIMFNISGEPMLSDFGIAKMLETDDAATLTGTGVGIGTPGYMAPEQWTGETSPQSDQYGLGVVLYEMLTGRKPYEADTPAGVLIKQTTQPLPLPSKFAPAIPLEVEVALLKSLDRDPTLRHADMAEFIKAYEGLLQQAPVVESKPVVVAASPHPADTYKTLDVVVTEEKPTPVTPADWATTADPLPKRKPINWKQIVIGGAALVVLAGVIWGGVQLSKGFPAAPEPTSISTRTPFHTTTPLATSTLIPTAAPVVMTREKDGMVMVYIPAGEFLMGSDPAKDKNAYDNEQPQLSVYLDEYWIDQTEVTNGMYTVCVDNGICTKPYSTSRYSDSSYANHPVAYVDWDQAKAYCDWAGADLPTEAQWERAARGVDGRTYPWGDANPSTSLLNYNNNVGGTTEVGSYGEGQSPFGMHDMAGNVWEWVNDWYEGSYYSQSPSSNPTGPGSGSSRVLRGGSLLSVGFNVRSAYRYRYDPTYNYNDLGFRCASPVSATPEPTPLPTLMIGETRISEKDGMVMVNVGDYLVDQTAITNAMFESFVQDTGYVTEVEKTNSGFVHNTERVCPTWTVCKPGVPGQDTTYPVTTWKKAKVNWRYWNSDGMDSVVQISWGDADNYCKWAGRRLLTEQEYIESSSLVEGSGLYEWVKEKRLVLGNSIIETSGGYLNYPDINTSEYSLDTLTFRCASSNPTPTTPVASAPQPTPTPVANALPEEIIDKKGVTMRLVPAGAFKMGSDSGGDHEKPAHTVTLNDYYMDVYEVTNAFYKACVAAGVCKPPSNNWSQSRSKYYGNSQYDNYPVIYVDWNLASAYCEWRGARLPTEAEWEKAARGTDGRTYPWGDADPTSSLLNFDGNFVDTTEVGSYENGKSPYGMYDMAGNVVEWVKDRYVASYYQDSPSENPQGPTSGNYRVVRGGAWYFSKSSVLTSARSWAAPTYGVNSIGFRCARDANP